MDVTARRRLGVRGPEVTRLGLGCAPIGNLLTAVTDEAAHATVETAWDAGIRLFDTAPLYGSGLSEIRLGRALRGRPRDEYVLSTKVGRVLEPGEPHDIFVDTPAFVARFDFSADGVRRSLDASLDRLGVDRVDVVLVHDPDDHEEQAVAEAFPTLLRLREEGVVRAVGAGMNQWEMLDRFVQRIDLDCVLLAGRFTLLERTAAVPFLDRCADRGVGVLLGGVFNSGILADPSSGPFQYEPADAARRADALRLADRCASRGIDLPAAALAFAASHPAVTSLVIGMRGPSEVRQDVAWAATDVPEGVWRDLDETRDDV